MGLVFYDTETTGLDTRFDQIVEFAAVHTDAELNSVERFEARCRIQPHIVASPEALLLNGLTQARLYDVGLPSHYQMVREVRDKLASWCPANFVGFNSIAFDEHLLRQAFYQTLHNPYLTSGPSCARSDVMRMLQAASVLVPGAITIPKAESGSPTFRLGLIAPENGYSEGRNHHAMSDVEATLFLARILLEKAPDVWSTAMRFSRKAAVTDFITNEPIFCLFEYFGGQPHAWLVTLAGLSPENLPEAFVYDLSVNPDELIHLNDVELGERLRIAPRPLRLVKTNAAPFLLQSHEAPGISVGLDIAESELQRRASVLASDPPFRARLVAAFLKTRPEKVPSPHIERQIYDALFSDADLRVMDIFHAAPWEERAELLKRLADGRLRRLGRRLIYLERPDVLPSELRTEYDRAITRRILGEDPNCEWLTLTAALEELNALQPYEGNAGHLADHFLFFKERLSTARAEASVTKATN